MKRRSIFTACLMTLGAAALSFLIVTRNARDARRVNVTSTNTASAFAAEQLKLGKKPNRLINEKSPYLLQHAFNPVDWYPWGEEAFRKAQEEDKPIFLSVGYSTCYWCHVMEREVFEDTAIARLMNEKLVCIKVDREERPDVDRVYMTAVQMMTGSGGWPMSIFMTADRKPFFGATYIPPRAQYGRMGFTDLLSRIDSVWRNDREKLLASSREIAGYLETKPAADSSVQLNDGILAAGYRQFAQNFDPEDAGFGGGPKFPRPVVFNFLLRYASLTGRDTALEMTRATLGAMSRGGMYDHIGGGFHRYSVDGKWRVPHFEKMLYDQAQLVSSYLEAYQLTHDESFASTARDVLAYVLQKLQSPEGGFYSAEDAESALDFAHPEEKEEGAFYLWTKKEIESLLKPEDAELFNYTFGVEADGNALQDPQGVFAGKNILYFAHPVEETASMFHKTTGEVRKILDDTRSLLFSARESRPKPHLDDKIITAWNGMMISAFAKAYQTLGDEKYLAAATRAADFVFAKLYDAKTRHLMRRYRDGEARFQGGLEDYAGLAGGLIDLYEASFDLKWLERAVELTQTQNRLFWDDQRHGYFDITGDDPTILVRTREEYDGAEPAGNSVAAMNLLRLAQMTDNPGWKSRAEQTISSSALLQRSPEAAPQMLAALAWNLAVPKEIVIAGDPAAADTRQLLREVHSRFIPFKVLLLKTNAVGKTGITKFLEFTEGMGPIGGTAAAYICENYACRLPTTDPVAVGKILDEKPMGPNTTSPR